MFVTKCILAVSIFCLEVNTVFSAHPEDTGACGGHCLFGCDEVTGMCKRCAPGWFGGSCDLMCDTNCEICDKVSGECLQCETGWYGDFCDMKCGEGCLSCNRTDGTCQKCDVTKWGSMCNLTCIENCNTCDIGTGKCKSCDDGYYGENCTQICGNCLKNVCGRISGECVFECNDGWFGSMCLDKCLPNCSYCNNKEICILCNPGLAGRKCEVQCPDNCNECTLHEDTNETACTECAEGLSLPSKNCSCSNDNCLKYGSKWDEYICQECTNGTFLYHGTCCPCMHCAGGSKNCDNEKGCIEGCAEGYYPRQSGCDKHCNIEHCVNCESFRGHDKICILCDSGWYPSEDRCLPCSKNCLGDLNECNNETGVCLHGCKDNWHSPLCDSLCNDTCVECDNDVGKCLVCALGYWGERCQYTCPDNCKLCYHDNGECDICNEGYHGVNCTKACVNCNGDICIEGTFDCELGCKAGWYGSSCEQKCLEHCAECHDATSCIVCKHNRLGDTCEFTCPEHCDGCSLNFLTNKIVCDGCKENYEIPPKLCSCTTSKCLKFETLNGYKTCTECENGWFAFQGKCCPCSQCDWDPNRCYATGVCPDECIPAFSIRTTNCTTECLNSDCAWCHVVPGGTEKCIGCKDGWYQTSGSCVPCNSQCRGNDNECDSVSGLCLRGCDEGWYGALCNTRCSQNCDICNEKKGICILCKQGYWGFDCNRKCEPNCRSCDEAEGSCGTMDKRSTCNRTTGHCLHGCKEGYFDIFCDDRCRRCERGICHHSTGRCLKGCVEGWTGETCNIRENGRTLPKLEPIVAGAVGGALFIVVIIILSICFIRKHKVPSKQMNNTHQRNRP